MPPQGQPNNSPGTQNPELKIVPPVEITQPNENKVGLEPENLPESPAVNNEAIPETASESLQGRNGIAEVKDNSVVGAEIPNSTPQELEAVEGVIEKNVIPELPKEADMLHQLESDPAGLTEKREELVSKNLQDAGYQSGETG